MPLAGSKTISHLAPNGCHHWKETHSDDWTLVDAETGELLARIFDHTDANLLGSWRWWVAPF